MAFVKKNHLKNLKCSYRCDFTPQIASQTISEHLKTKFLLRSMPEPLDNASNSFPKKLKILDRTLSSQNMRGQTAHNRPSSSNPLGEKGDILCLRQASCVYVPTLSLQVSGIPWRICSPSDLYLCCSTWMGLNRYFHHLFTWWNCLSLYLWTLSAEKSCGSDCMIRNQKSGWTLHWILHPRANLFSDQSLMVHGLYIYRLSLALYPGSLSTKLCSHFETVSDFTMPNHPLPFLSEHQPSFS